MDLTPTRKVLVFQIPLKVPHNRDVWPNWKNTIQV